MCGICSAAFQSTRRSPHVVSGNSAIEGAFFASRPVTYRALQRVVMAAAHANTQIGKKGLFGGDKHAVAVEELKVRLRELCKAIDTDGDMIYVHMDDSWSRFSQHRDYLLFTNDLIAVFKQVYPNWPDAYRYWSEFFQRAHQQGIKRY